MSSVHSPVVPKPFVVGVDGCREGWVAVSLDQDHNWQVEVFQNIDGLWNACQQARLILIDIPIGLPGDGVMSRRCDAEARKLLGKRHCTVFSAPCRESLHAATHAEASNINRQRLGKGMSCQCFHILKKVEQVDAFLRGNPEAALVMREVHPEVCFWSFNRRQAITDGKKSAPGREERLRVLSTVFPPTYQLFEEAVRWRRESHLDVATDDIIDALAAAVTGLRPNRLESIPQPKEQDAAGLPMEMVYRRL